jgi:hypothetical protein
MILSFSPKKGFTLQTRKEGDNSLNPAGKKVLKKVQENSSRTKKPKANVALVAVAQNSDLPEP